MTRENERLQFDIFLAPLSHRPPGYKSLCICSLSSLITHFMDLIPLFVFPSYFQKGSSDSHSSEELPTQGDYKGLPFSSAKSDAGAQELFEELNLSSTNDKGSRIN